MTSGIKTIIYPVDDLARAKAFYATVLGVEPSMDEAYYVQFNLGDLEIGLDPQGHQKGLQGAVAYWHIDDIEQSFKALIDGGAQEQQAITEFNGGWRKIAAMRDVDGNVVGLLQQS